MSEYEVKTNRFPQLLSERRIPTSVFRHFLVFFEFEIVREKTQPGRDEGVMEDRKAAPALRARLLRSYVPLRCVRAKVRPPALPHPFPAETFSTHKFKSQDCTEKNTIFLKNLLK